MDNQEDGILPRMEKWEKGKGRKMKDLSESEWLDVMTKIQPWTRMEAEEYLNYLRGQL